MLRRDFLDLLACPACHGALVLSESSWDDAKLRSGALSCSDCSLTYRIESGLPLLYVADERWEPCAREAQGWIELHKSLGIYDQTGVDIDFQLPYYPGEPWLEVARHFDAGLELAQLNGHETVLDLGAGRGWAAKHFALRGCRVAAIDVVTDDQVGLGRAWALMADSGVSFAPVIGDFERLPFSDCTFDVVFCAAALHHAPDLTRMLRDVLRVLKPSGRLVAVNEPCIGAQESEQDVLQRDAAQEVSFGIRETRPSLQRYWSSLEGAGFRAIRVLPLQAYALDDKQLKTWAQGHLGGRLGWRARRRRSALLPPGKHSRRDALLYAVLAEVPLAVLITAAKPQPVE
jgi:SAM-dependent methyltransferase